MVESAVLEPEYLISHLPLSFLVFVLFGDFLASSLPQIPHCKMRIIITEVHILFSKILFMI